MSRALKPLPSFLSVPLSSPDVLAQIHRALEEREQYRRKLAADSQAARRLKATPTAQSFSGGSAADGERRFDQSVGLGAENVKKNRYCDIVAYDRTRFLLPPEEGEEYVNASLILEPEVGVDLPRRWWVAAQAPTSRTLPAFLSMLLTPPSSPSTSAPLPLISLIIQLTPLVEQSRQKCHRYFPPNVGETWELLGEHGRGVWVTLERKEVRDGSRMSTLRVARLIGQRREEGRTVVHVEYLGWGDHGVPDDPSHLLRFLRFTTALNDSLSPSNMSPILLHCSAGVGRTGTYITISSLLPLLTKLRQHPTSTSNPVPIPSLPVHSPNHPLPPYPAELAGQSGPDLVGYTIDSLRDQRCTMVQTRGQVEWCFIALQTAWEEATTEVGK